MVEIKALNVIYLLKVPICLYARCLSGLVVNPARHQFGNLKQEQADAGAKANNQDLQTGANNANKAGEFA